MSMMAGRINGIHPTPSTSQKAEAFIGKLQHNVTTFIVLIKQQKAFGISICTVSSRRRREMQFQWVQVHRMI